MKTKLSILLVEDNEGDVELTREAFLNTTIPLQLIVVNDGEEAMKLLRKEGHYKNVMRPDLILLDLNLPKKDGRQVLEEIKRDSNLKTIPIVILTTSSAEEDIQKTYNNYASAYIEKPVIMSEFAKIVNAIDIFWLHVVTLPRGIKGQDLPSTKSNQ